MSEKRENNRSNLLRLLSNGRQHHMTACAEAGGWRYGARIHELRKQGYVIETIRLGEDEFAYRLVVKDRQLELV